MSADAHRLMMLRHIIDGIRQGGVILSEQGASDLRAFLDRIAALEAELTEARRSEEATSKLFDITNGQTQAAVKLLDAERAAHERTKAERDAAQAEAAAMREALKGAKQWMFTHCAPDSENGKAYRRDKQQVMDALTGDAGRALAARAPLLEAVATAARKRLAVWTRETYGDLVDALAALDGAK